MQTMLEAIKAKITLICASAVFITLMGANLSISQETTETEEIILPDPIEILDDSLFVQSSSDLTLKALKQLSAIFQMKPKIYLANTV